MRTITKPQEKASVNVPGFYKKENSTFVHFIHVYYGMDGDTKRLKEDRVTIYKSDGFAISMDTDFMFSDLDGMAECGRWEFLNAISGTKAMGFRSVTELMGMMCDTIEKYPELYCNDCNWEGTQTDLEPGETENGITEGICPDCHSTNISEL